MAELKISGMTAANPLDGSELVELSQVIGGSPSTVSTTTKAIAYAAAKYGAFHDGTDQTGSTVAATSVKLGQTDFGSNGVTVVTDGAALTRITYADGGVYMVAPSLQFVNSDAADHDTTIWLAKNGTAVPTSATRITVPKASDGGAACFQFAFYVRVAAGDYITVQWLPENAAVTLDSTAAGAIAPAVPAAIVVTERVGL